MSGALMLAVGALAFRAVGSALRVARRSAPLRVVGWMVGSVGAWLGVAAIGGWTPLWVPLAFGTVGGLVALWRNSRALAAGTDLASFAPVSLLSLPPVALLPLVGGCFSFAVAGWVLDALLRRRPALAATGLVAAPLLIVAFTVAKPGLVFESLALVGPFLPTLGVTAPLAGERIVLSDGSVAWLNRPSTGGSHPGALFFHGNHPAGSRQKAATVLRRSLVDAGYTVLAVDHPGYGESPHAEPGAGIDAWDPTPAVVAAFDWLRADEATRSVVAIGHSLGCVDVVRLLVAGRRPDGVILFGAGLSSGAGERERYWYKRFHEARRMKERLPLDRYRAIMRRYYDLGHLLSQLDGEHPEIVLGFFEREHADIAATREMLIERIPGPKRIWWIDSTHYFESYTFAGLIVGDTTVTRAVSRWLRRYGEKLGS